MKALLAAALLMAATLSLHAAPSTYQQDYADLKAKVGKEHLEQHLTDWRKREPDNPDAWILSANWALEQADGISVKSNKGSQLPEGNYTLELRGEKIVVLDRKGKPVGGIVPDPAQVGTVKAAFYISEGLKKWPHRADMHCGLATVYARGAMWNEHVAALRAMVDAARTQKGKLRWCHNESLEEPEDVFLADKLHDFARQQFDLETKASDQRFFEIAQITVRACPNSPKGYNDIAIYHGLSKNWKAAQPVLEKASKVAPDDALVWLNYADNSQRLSKPDLARKAYQHVVELDSDPALVKAAREKLAAMDAPKP